MTGGTLRLSFRKYSSLTEAAATAPSAGNISDCSDDSWIEENLLNVQIIHTSAPNIAQKPAMHPYKVLEPNTLRLPYLEPMTAAAVSPKPRNMIPKERKRGFSNA